MPKSINPTLAKQHLKDPLATAEIERDEANPTLETLNKIGRQFKFAVGFVPRRKPE